MGEQISCEIGPSFIEITISLQGSPIYPNTPYFYSSASNTTFYYLHYTKSSYLSFKTHELYSLLTKSSIPVQVSGVTYDGFFAKLSADFDAEFSKTKGVQHTVEALDYIWTNDRSKFYECEMIKKPPADGRLWTDEDGFVNTPVRTSELYPYVLVNIKSGVSIVLARSANDFEKIGGSCIGLATIWALLKSQGIESVDQLIEEAAVGNNTNVDMTVEDIYGCRYSMFPEKIIASTLGKLKDKVQYKREDLAKSLLFMLIYNLGQITSLYCFDLQVTQVVVVGSIFTNEFVTRLMRFSWNFYSKNILKLILCENGQFLRSMGVLLSIQKQM